MRSSEHLALMSFSRRNERIETKCRCVELYAPTNTHTNEHHIHTQINKSVSNTHVHLCRSHMNAEIIIGVEGSKQSTRR